MKKVLIALVVLTFSIQLNAQKIELSSLSLSSGNGPLSQGLLFESNFSNGKDLVNLTLGERDMYAFYLKSFVKSKVLVGPCLEYFHNVPIIGLITITSPFKNVSTFSWVGYSAGIPDSKVELLKWRFLFIYQSVDYTYKRFTTSGAIMYYDGWQPILDFKYKQPLMKNVSLFTSAGYNFFGSGSALLRLGAVYSLN